MSDSFGSAWNSRQMLDMYVYDYLVKKSMRRTAAIFMQEAEVDASHQVVIDQEDGFLLEWWRFFYDVYTSGMKKSEEVEIKPMTQNGTQGIPYIPPHHLPFNLKMPSEFPLETDFDQDFRSLSTTNLTLLPTSTTSSRCIQQQTCDQGQQLIAQTRRTETKEPEDQCQCDEGKQQQQSPQGSGNEVQNPNLEEVEIYLSAIDKFDKEGNALKNSRYRSTACTQTDNEGFSFTNISSLQSSKGKLLCCRFSPDDKLLASAGHDKKVFIWNMDTFEVTHSSQIHSLLITDVAFQPSSTIFATSSFDKTVQVWDATNLSKSLLQFHGHKEHVMSLDFHPRKVDHLCSCDTNDEIRIWNVNTGTSQRASKGASKQVRFQPHNATYLATASGNNIHIMDSDLGGIQFKWQGHTSEVLSICWDPSGEYLATVSEERARVWSILGGKCVTEISSYGSKFRSCIFHPRYCQLLIIGGYQTLEFCNATESNKTWSFPAHSGFVSALAGSHHTSMIASASHNHFIKLWK